jgi:hypothetical protein
MPQASGNVTLGRRAGGRIYRERDRMRVWRKEGLGREWGYKRGVERRARDVGRVGAGGMEEVKMKVKMKVKMVKRKRQRRR